MKKILALIMAFAMLFLLSACGDEQDVQHDEIMAAYSIKNIDSKDFIVEVQNMGGVYEQLYDANGIVIKFRKGAKLVDSEGNEIKREDINYGDTLIISYDGTLAKKNPKTIKAYKVTKI